MAPNFSELRTGVDHSYATRSTLTDNKRNKELISLLYQSNDMQKLTMIPSRNSKRSLLSQSPLSSPLLSSRGRYLASSSQLMMFSMATVVSIVCLATIVIGADSSGDNQSLLDRCCQIGKQKAIANTAFDCKMSASEALRSDTSSNNATHYELVSNSGTYSDQCEMLLESCCMAHHRTRNCYAGKQFAHSGSGCMDVELSKTANVATESFNDCCMACSLGILAARQPSTSSSGSSSGSSNARLSNQQLTARCKLISPLASSLSGQLYEQTYIDCCHQSLPRPVLNLLTPGSAVSCSQRNVCSQRCVEAGTYDPVTQISSDQDKCQCFAGYRLASDNVNCIDIDECAEQLDSCNRQSEICDNTRGAYRCLARETSVGSSRNPKSIHGQDSPASSLSSSSSWHSHSQFSQTSKMLANNGDSGPLTAVSSLSTLSVIPGRCNSQRDQCDTRTQRCVDTSFGGYTCLPIASPSTRISLIRKRRHIAHFEAIESEAEITTSTPKVESSNQQECSRGFRPTQSASGNGFICEDIDECLLGTNRCREENHEICVNTNGSYACRCEVGFSLNLLGKCQDADECSGRGDELCPPDISHCANEVGTYKCVCNPGFRHDGDNTKLCVDIDECKEMEGNCDHNCVNTYGSHMCTCRTGYKLASDGRSCEDIDECQLLANNMSSICPHPAFCVNVPGSFQCQCPQGYRMSNDLNTCVDINECLEDPLRCGSDRVCFNTRGGFKCNTIICPDGYVKDSVNRNKCKLSTKPRTKHQPVSITYNYVTFPNELNREQKSHQLFTMRGPKNPDIDAKFELKLLSATKSGQPDVRLAKRSDFSITEPNFNEAVVSLIRPIQGPQDIELDLELRLYLNKVLQSVQMAKLIIYVTRHPSV